MIAPNVKGKRNDSWRSCYESRKNRTYFPRALWCKVRPKPTPSIPAYTRKQLQHSNNLLSWCSQKRKRQYVKSNTKERTQLIWDQKITPLLMCSPSANLLAELNFNLEFITMINNYQGKREESENLLEAAHTRQGKTTSVAHHQA